MTRLLIERWDFCRNLRNVCYCVRGPETIHRLHHGRRVSDEALVLPYGYLYEAVWFKGTNGREIMLHHRVRRLYIQGENLGPLLRSFEYYTVRTVHIFDPDRHAPVNPGACVVTHIDDKYGGS